MLPMTTISLLSSRSQAPAICSPGLELFIVIVALTLFDEPSSHVPFSRVGDLSSLGLDNFS